MIIKEKQKEILRSDRKVFNYRPLQEVECSTRNGGTCPNDLFDPTDQDIRTKCDLSWKNVVSEWQLVTALSAVASALAIHVHAKHNTH